MTVLEDHRLDIAVRIARLLASELEQAVDRDEFGVIAQDIEPVDMESLVASLAHPRFTRSKRLRVALIGQPAVVEAAVARYSSLADLLSADEEVAVAWRNQRLRTIAVITNRPLAKAASLREFRVIGERDLSRRLCAEQRDAAEVSWLRTLWDALQGGRTLRIPLEATVRFAGALDRLSAAERSSQAPRHLHVLGLFPDAHLADDRSEQRLRQRLSQNRELAAEVLRATDDDWSRIRVYCAALPGPDCRAGRRLAQRLREVSAGTGGTFEGIDFTQAQTLWKGKVPGRSLGGGSGEGNGVTRIEVERIVGRRLLTDDQAPLADIAEEIKQIVQEALDDDARPGMQDVRQASDVQEISTVHVDREILELVRSRSSAQDWGGVIEVASGKPATLTEIASFKSWTPFGIDAVQSGIASFTQAGLAPAGLLDLLDQLQRLRAQMVPLAPELALAPVAVLAGTPDLLAVAEAYLATYEQFLRQLHAAYREMHAAADFEAEQVLGRVLCLELYVYRKDGQIEAVMSPLHPLYLWRNVTLVREVRGLGAVLSDHEIETVEQACADEIQILQVLILPREATALEQPILLGQAGRLGRLPIFREAPRGMLEADGVRTVAQLAQHLARLRPFVRPGLQVMLVNLPRPALFIDALVGQLDLENTSSDETFWGIHVRVRYTHPDTRGWANEVSDLDDALKEQLSAGEERGLLSLSVRGETTHWEDLERDLADHPAHLTVVFDPFEVRSTPVARAQMHTLSPWMPTCEYRVNRLRKEIQVLPVAEEHVFGSYLAAASLIHTALQQKTPAHLPQVREMKDVLDRIAESSTWTIVADPHRVPLARLGGAEVIDRRVEKGRQLTCFAHDLAPFVRRLDQQLRRTHFLAENGTLQRLVRDLVAMEPNGILGLADTNHEKQVKGSLGKLIAVSWYRMQEPSGLAVSLDTESASRWLVAGHHSREKADLLGLREEGDAIVIDVIEVKTHDETTPYTVSDGLISGTAVGQVLATLQALAEVFSPDARSPLAKPRREVLREHLYTALLRDQEPRYIERWHALLEEVFSGKIPVRLSGRIIHVQLASVAPRESRVYGTATGVPIRVDTLSAEDVGYVLRSSKVTRIENPTPEPGIAAADRLDPAVALARLLTHPSSPSDAGAPRIVETDYPKTADPLIAGHQESAPGGQPLHPVGHHESMQTSGPSEIPSYCVNLDVHLGTEHASANVVHWVPGKQSNGFFLILGASGSGKTETLKVLGSSILESGIPVLVFDFHGDVTFPGLNSILLSSGSASVVGLNPMELDVHSAQESGLYDQRAALRGMVQRAVPALGHRQTSILREAFDEAYRRAGILDTEPATWSRPVPTFGDVQNILSDWIDDDARKGQRAGIEGCLAAVQHLFDHPIFRRDAHIALDEILTRAVRLDLSKLPDQVRFIATETLLRNLFRALRLRGPIPVQPADDRQRFRLFVIIDEAKILSLGGGERDRADNILNELITEARKFGLGMVLASQMSEHFSEEVRANAATWLVLKPMDIREAKKNAPNVSVDPEDLMHLAGRGDGYYRDRPSSRARRLQVRPLVGG